LKEPQQTAEMRRRAEEDLAEAIKSDSSNWEDLVQIGYLCLEVGKVEESVTQFNRAESVAPNEVDVYLARSVLAIDLNDGDGGAAVLDRAFKLPLGERRYDLLAPAVELYSISKRPKDARARLEEARTPEAPAEVLRYLEGVVAFADNNMADATSKLEEAVKLAPEDPRLTRAYLWLGRAYAAGGNPRRAISPYKEFVRRSTSGGGAAATGQMELSRLYADLGRWEEAARASFEARRSPLAARAAVLRAFHIGGLMARPGGAKPDAKQIEALYGRVSELSAAAPKDVDFRIQLARLTYYKGDLEAAIKILKSAREELGEKVLTTRALIAVYVEAGKFKEAIEECTAAIASIDKAQVPSLQTMLAEVYAQQGDQEMARKTFTAAAEQAGGSERTMIRSQMADWLVRQQHPEEARQLLARVVEDDPTNVAVMGKLLALKPDPQQFTVLIERLKKAEGQSGLNWRYWQAVSWIDSADWQKHGKEIVANLSECLAKDPEFSEASLVLGLYHEKGEEWERALEVYRKAVALNPGNDGLAFRLLRVASKLGRWMEVDQVLAGLPKEVAGNPDLERFIQQLRIQQAVRRGDAGAAVTLLEEQVKDAENYTARLQLAMWLARSPEGKERARKLLAEAAEIAPDAPDALAARVQFHVDQSEFKEAIELCGQSITKKPSAETLRMRSRVYEAQGDLVAAAADLKQMAGLEGKVEEGYLALGQLYYRHGQPQQAVESWEAGCGLAPDSYRLRGALAEVRLSSGDKAEQEKGRLLLDALLKERPDDEQFLLMRVEALLASDDKGQIKACEDICNQVLAKNPKSTQAFYLLAKVTLLAMEQAVADRDLPRARQERARALDYLDRGLVANSQDARLLLMQSELLMAESPNRALLAARAALDLEPSNERAAIACARSLGRSEQTKEAVNVLTRYLSRVDAKDSFAARLTLAQAQIGIKDYASAEVTIKEAEALVASDKARQLAVDQARLELLGSQELWEPFVALARECVARNAGDDDLVVRVGATLLQSKDPGAAKTGVEFMAMLVERHPDDPAVFSQLGLAQYQVGQLQEAATTFEQGLKLDPGHLRLLNDLAWLVCEDQKKPQEAAKRVAAAVDKIRDGGKDSVVASLWDTWGVIQYRLGKLDESKEALERCLAFGVDLEDSTRQSAQFHLARTLSTTDKPRAVQLLEGLLALPKERLALSAADQDEARALLDKVKT